MKTLKIAIEWGAAAAVAVVVFSTGCATTPATVERFRAPLPGSTATHSQTRTGSFGSGTVQLVTTYGEQTRQGAPVLCATSSAGTMLMRPTDGNRIGFVGSNGPLPRFRQSPADEELSRPRVDPEVRLTAFGWTLGGGRA
jgi:hypothetical protein